jgi:hypothetical protein
MAARQYASATRARSARPESKKTYSPSSMQAMMRQLWLLSPWWQPNPLDMQSSDCRQLYTIGQLRKRKDTPVELFSSLLGSRRTITPQKSDLIRFAPGSRIRHVACARVRSSTSCKSGNALLERTKPKLKEAKCPTVF